MKREKLLVSSSLLCLVLLLLACTPPTTPTSTPTVKAIPSPTSKPAAAPTLSPSPTSKPTTTAAPVSFEGKTVTLVSVNPPGGGGDLMARVWAKHLPQFIPGKPIMIVRSMPGGAGTIGANYAYSSKPDGLTIFLAGGVAMSAQLLGISAARYDLSKMPACVAISGGNVFMTRPSVVDKPENLLKAKGMIFGYSSGPPGWAFVCAKELMGIPTEKVVLAYGGGGDALRAFLAGEINTSSTSGESYSQTLVPLVKSREAVLLFQAGAIDGKGNVVRDPLYSSAPTIQEVYEMIYTKSPSGIVWEATKAAAVAGGAYDKVLVLVPGTPDRIVRAYWDAAEKMVKDPEFLRLVEPVVGGASWKTG